MSWVDIRNPEQAEPWFAEQTPERQCLMASRGALRVIVATCAFAHPQKKMLMLACLRAALISSVFGSRNLPDPSSIRREAEAARAAIELAVSNAGRVAGHHSSLSEKIVAIGAAKAIGASAIAVFSPDDARLAFWAPLNGIQNEVPYDIVFSFCREDIAQGEGDLRNSPIWNGRSVPSSFAQRTQSWLSHIDSQTDWSFWHRWYKQMTSGTFQEWDLAIEVAKIPDEVWKGEDAVARVAEAIQAIEKRLRTRVGPQLVKTPSGKFDLEEDIRIDDEPITFAIGQVEIALRAVLSGDGTNGFTAQADEAQLIKVACTEYRDQHSNVATAFWNACMGLQHNIGDVYPEDRSLTSLQNTLYVSVEEMCAHSDLIRDRIARLAALETRRYPTQEEREALLQLPEIIAEDTTDRANAQIEAAVEHVANTERPARVWRAKLVNWITTLSRGIEQGQKTEKKVNWLIGLSQRITGWFFDDEEPGGNA